MLKIFKKKGQTVIEFMVLITIIMASFVVFQKYIARAINGRWRGVGESIGYGQVYDPGISAPFFGHFDTSVKTRECAFDYVYGTNSWYDKDCFKAANCDCVTVAASSVTCQDCISTCNSSGNPSYRYCDP